MPQRQHWQDCGVLHSCQCCRCRRPYPKAVADVMILKNSNRTQYCLYLSNEAGLGDRVGLVVSEPGAPPPPPPPPRLARNFSIADTGHSSFDVRPRIMSAPLPSWSVFECFRWTLTMPGSEWLSNATSPQARCSLGLNAVGKFKSSSPSWEKPVQLIAHRSRHAGLDNLSHD